MGSVKRQNAVPLPEFDLRQQKPRKPQYPFKFSSTKLHEHGRNRVDVYPESSSTYVKIRNLKDEQKVFQLAEGTTIDELKRMIAKEEDLGECMPNLFFNWCNDGINEKLIVLDSLDQLTQWHDAQLR